MARTILAALALWLLLASPAAYAIDPAPRPPVWLELTPEQQLILTPVARNWNLMTAKQRFKLLGVAKAYPKMSIKEKQRVQQRLKEWADLTPEQRELARNKYLQLKQLPPEKRQEVKQKWQEKIQQQSTAPAPPMVAQPGAELSAVPATSASDGGAQPTTSQPQK